MLYKRKMKMLMSVFACTAVMLSTSCGSLPSEYPGIEENPEIIEMGERFKVNFFFQNNENTYCIRPDGDAYNFFNALSETFSVMSYSDVSRTYVLDYNDESSKYSIEEYNRTKFDNLTWEDAKDLYSCSGKKKDSEENFYILENNHDISMESRVEGGMLKLYLDEVEKAGINKNNNTQSVSEEIPEESADEEASAEQNTATDSESFFDPDAINVMFTDLSEKNITYLGEELRRYYTDDNRYNACVLAVKLELQPDSTLFYASKDNANSLTKNASKDSRWYYLVMTGPSTDLAVFVQNLTTHLNDLNMYEGTESGGYEISDLSFTSENFDADADITVKSLSNGDSEQTELQSAEGDNALFENCLVRLEAVEDKESVFPVGIYRDGIIEYKYNYAEKEYGLKGYNGEDTADFALNVHLDKEVKSYDLVAESTELSYVFGEPVVYYQNGEEWAEMDSDHKERFFHLIDVEKNDGKTLTIISDNSDECDIHDVYITVPILQRATISQVVSSEPDSTTSWILNECTFKSSDTAEEVKKTYYFDKFFINLFDLEIEGSRDENNNLYDSYRDVYSQIDELKILIEDIH